MRRFRVSPLPPAGATALLPLAVSHHLLRVVGIARGEAIGLFDGLGHSASGVLREVVDGAALVEVGAHDPISPAPAPTWLLQGLPKHEAFDTVVRMSTELGVTHLWPVLAARSVARGDRLDRWLRLAESAATQCGRADLPEIRPPVPLRVALDALPDGLQRRVYLRGAPTETHTEGPAALLLGPEGGLCDEEIDLALAAGFQPEGLGPNTLRAETAAAAALARRI